MGKHNDQLFRKVVTGNLRKQHTAGAAQGAYAMCKVIRDKATDETKTVEQRLEDVVGFCNVCLNFASNKPTGGDANEV